MLKVSLNVLKLVQHVLWIWPVVFYPMEPTLFVVSKNNYQDYFLCNHYLWFLKTTIKTIFCELPIHRTWILWIHRIICSGISFLGGMYYLSISVTPCYNGMLNFEVSYTVIPCERTMITLCKYFLKKSFKSVYLNIDSPLDFYEGRTYFWVSTSLLILIPYLFKLYHVKKKSACMFL